MTFATRDKFACAERELKMRQRVYPHLINRGKMTLLEAEHELLVMQAIVEDYRGAVAAEEPEFEMFVEARKTTGQC
jgi:hypothetical protein